MVCWFPLESENFKNAFFTWEEYAKGNTRSFLTTNCVEFLDLWAKNGTQLRKTLSTFTGPIESLLGDSQNSFSVAGESSISKCKKGKQFCVPKQGLVCSASGLLGHLQGGEVNSRNRSFP
jgi:hypothetical protein